MGWFSKKPKTNGYARAAIAKFEQLAPAAPVIDEARLHSEYEDLRGSWRGPSLITGSREYITAVVRANIEHDASAPDYGDTMVQVLDDDCCVQVSSIFTAGAGRALAYRVWRTPQRYALFSSSPGMIVPAPGA